MSKSIHEVKTETIDGVEHILIDATEPMPSLSELEEYALELESFYEDEDIRHFTRSQDAKMNRRIMR